MNILITGPTNGIGRETALELARQGHQLFLLCRNEQAGNELAEEIKAIPTNQGATVLKADLGDMQSVRDAVKAFEAMQLPLHVLINNAGVVNTSQKIIEVEGRDCEQMFAVNYLGPYLLTRLLLPVLEKTAEESGERSRIVVVASDAHALFCKGLDFEDLYQLKDFSTFKAYGRSKLGNILMTHQLAKTLDPKVVQINSLHPGAVNSKLGDNNVHWYTPFVKAIISPFFISSKKGAATSIYLATQNIDTQGLYYIKCKPAKAKPWAMDDAAAQRLWDESGTLLGLD